MAAAMTGNAGLSQRRRRPLTYGRLSQRSAPGPAYTFDGRDPPNLTDRSRPASLPQPKSPRQAVNTAIDVFDIPSSEDETAKLKPQQRLEPLRHQNAKGDASLLPPNVYDVPSSDEDVRSDPQRTFADKQAKIIGASVKNARKTARDRSSQHPTTVISQQDQTNSSPQAVKRRRLSTSPSPKKQSMGNRGDQRSAAVDAHHLETKRTASLARTTTGRMSVHPTEITTAGRLSVAEQRRSFKSPPSNKTPSRTPVANSVSAPAALDSMVSRGGQHPSTTKVLKTSVHNPRTPEKSQTARNQVPLCGSPRKNSKSPTRANEADKLIPTPKQAKLWGSLLASDNTTSVRSTTGSSKVLQVHPGQQLHPRQSEQKKRLIDTLGTSAEQVSSSDDEYSENNSLTSRRLARGAAVEPSGALHENSPSRAHGLGIPRSQAKITYGGQHSYLDESTAGIESLLTQSTDCAPILTSTRDLTNPGRTKSRNELKDMDLTEEDETVNTMRSIHELRASGDSIRFENDLAMEDIEITGKSSISRKRSALLQVAERLNDAEFRDRCTQYGLELRIMISCRNETDLIIGTAVATILSYTLGLSSSLHTAQQLYEAGAVEFLVRLLEDQRDIMTIAKARAANMSKVAQTSVNEFKKSLLKSALWAGALVESISPTVVALKGLDFLIQRLRKEKVKDPILTPQLLDVLLHLVDFALYKSDGDLAAFGKFDSVFLQPVLSMLESFTVVESCALQTSLWNLKTLSQLVDKLDDIMSLPAPWVDPLLPLILRICLNLSNNAEENIGPFSKPRFVAHLTSLIKAGLLSLRFDKGDVNSIVEFDNLVLSLGAMFNLAEWSDSVRLVTLHNCRADLDVMLDVFTVSRSQASEADSLAASSANVAYGYLAILLGHLCQNDEVRMYIRTKLPGSSLAPLSTAVEEFIVHHNEADKGQESNETWIAFTRRLAMVAGGLKQMCKGSNTMSETTLP